MTEDTTEKRFARFIEANEHEGETWNFWLELTGDNGGQLETLQERIWDATVDENGEAKLDAQEFALTEDVEDETIVDALVLYSDEAGYMPTHQKVTGVFTCPEDLGEHLEKLYKGGIKDLFVTEEMS